LRAQAGRPWSKVFSEIASRLDRRNTVQQHVYQHLDDFIAIQVEMRGDEFIDLRRPHYWRHKNRITQELYVDPRTGLIRRNKHYRTWKREEAEQDRLRQAEIHSISVFVARRRLMIRGVSSSLIVKTTV
jgi:hypothetical protein